MKLILSLLINVAALLILPSIIPGITVDGVYIAFITAIVLGILNTLIRPIVQILALPITILTLGLFALVINAGFFYFVSTFIQGFTVESFVAAFWGSLIMCFVSWITNQLSK